MTRLPHPRMAGVRDLADYRRLCVLCDRYGLRLELHAAGGGLSELAVEHRKGCIVVTAPCRGRSVWEAAREILAVLDISGERA